MRPFIGTKYTKINKNHLCYTCSHNIEPNGKDSIRHDTWNINGKIINKYYCKTCEDFIIKENNIDNCPYNPYLNEFRHTKPAIYTCHFQNHYKVLKDRENAIEDIESFIKGGIIYKIKFFIAKLLLKNSLFGSNYRFVYEDYKIYKMLNEIPF